MIIFAAVLREIFMDVDERTYFSIKNLTCCGIVLINEFFLREKIIILTLFNWIARGVVKGPILEGIKLFSFHRWNTCFKHTPYRSSIFFDLFNSILCCITLFLSSRLFVNENITPKWLCLMLITGMAGMIWSLLRRKTGSGGYI
jgi:hypothetical protein